MERYTESPRSLSHPAPDVTAPALLVTAAGDLAAEVRRLGAAAGLVPEVVADPTAALRRWSTAPVVLVGADLAGVLAGHAPVRRDQVHVLSGQPVPDECFRHAVGLGAESVAELPRSAEWLVELLADAGEEPRRPATTLGVVGGSGGAGATTFAAALALRAASGSASLLVDADVLGAGIERVLGIEQAAGVRWDAMMAATGRLSARSLREALPRRDRLHVLGFGSERPADLPAFAVREVLSAARRAFSCVVVDLPRHRSPAVEETMARCDRLILVSTLTVPGVTATARVAARIPPTVSRVLVTRGGPAGISPAEVSRIVGVPLLRAMGDQRGLDEAVNLGAGPLRSGRGVLARTARQCLDELVRARAA